MKSNHTISSIALGAAILSAGTIHAFAQEETLKSLAAERGRYVGAILNSGWFNGSLGGDQQKFEETHKAQFNAVVAENEMKFDATEPNNNRFSYSNGDKMVKYAKENGMRVRGHALAWHSQVPGWVSSGNYNKEQLLKILKNHIDSVVTHWKGQVDEWDVVNEAINDDPNHGWRTGSIWFSTIGAEFLDSAFVWAHAADPDAELCYNDYAIEWGIGNGSKAGFLLEQVKRWKDNGIPITCVGTQTHIENSHIGTPENVRTLARELAKLDITLNITELDIGFPQGTNPTPEQLAQQGHLYRQFMDVFLEEPNMGEFMIWGVSDKYSWLDQSQGKTKGLIYDNNFNPKPAYDSLIASLKAHSPESVKSPYSAKITSSASAESSSSAMTEVSSSDGISSSGTDGISPMHNPQGISMRLAGRTLSIAGATSATVDVFDMQGRPVFRSKCEKGSVELNIAEGLYMVRVRDGSASLVQKVAVK